MSLFNLPAKFATSRILYGKQVRNFPFSYDQTHFTVTEHRFIKAGFYSPTPLNTRNARYATAFLVKETPVEEQADGVWYEQVYATIPAIFRDYQTYTGTFPAWLNQRSEFVEATRAVAVHEYFMIGAGTEYPTVDAIPFIPQTRVSFATIFSTPVPILMGGFYLNNGGPFVNTSSPPLAHYQALVELDAADTTNYSIVAEASKPVHYIGNIWDRVTLFVKAR